MGGLVGLVVGDALGVPVEFSGRAMRDQDPVVGMRGYGTHNQPPGTWSDDGALALAAANCLADNGWDLDAIKRGFLAWIDDAWWTSGGTVFDVGNATRWALARVRRGLPWQECGGDEENDNGNGSLMRLLPTSVWLFGRPSEELIACAGDAGAITHAHVRARLCCSYHALVCDALLSGRSTEEAVRQSSDRLRRYVPTSERECFNSLLTGVFLQRKRSEVRSDGYVVSTLEASLWCLHNHPTFTEAVLAAVNLGGDTDTTAAVTGGLAGLRSGMAGIPAEWIAALPRSAEVLALADRFAEACVRSW